MTKTGDSYKDKVYWINTWSRFKGGDRSAFEEIYSEYIDTLFAYGSKITGDKELVKDSIQDLFVDMYRYKINLQKPESFEFYMFKAYKRIVFKKLKKKQKIAPIGEIDFLTFNVEEDYIQNELEESKLQTLQQALNAMKPKNRELLFYKFNSNLTYKEIGQLTGVNSDTVKKQVHRLLHGLRENFKTKLPYITIMCFITP